MAGKADIWMPLYIGDYLSATTHLSAEESGGYLHLLMHAWKNGSLPAEEEALRRIARIDKDAWSNAWAVIQQFFDQDGGFPVQRRLESIRADWEEKKAAAAKKAIAAAAARWGKGPVDASSIPSGKAQGVPEPCPSPSPSPISLSKKTTSSSHPDKSGEGAELESVYKVYPRQEGRRAALKAITSAYKRLVKGESPEKPMGSRQAWEYLYQAVREYAESPSVSFAEKTNIPHPSTWFNQSRYLDDRSMWQQTGDGGGRRNRSQERTNSNIANMLRASGSDHRSAAERRRDIAADGLLKTFPEVFGTGADGAFNDLDDRHIPQPDSGRGGSKVLEGRLV